uniref:Mycosubtilin synthase subunit C-like n=1 Tax=Drosophila arizonae TaxID=7263 RepID=A0ABM1Q5F7_DROAR
MGSLPQLSIVKGQQQDYVPRALHRIFEEQQLRHADKVALIYHQGQGQSLAPSQSSYRQMNERANRAARLLVEEAHGRFLQPNSDGDFIVAVCMQPSEALVTTLLAIWKAGGAYLPIDPSFPANRVHHILLEARPILVLRDDDIDAQRFQGTPTLSLTELYAKSLQLSGGNLLSEEMLRGGNEHIAIVLYTSGSTGVPKGVRLPHENILNRLQWQWATFPYTANEQVGVFKTALTFVDSIAELWGPLMSSSFFDYFDEGVHRLYNFYGSTEVMGDVTYFACESKKQLSMYDNVPIGVPVSNTVIYLLDADYRPVKNGEIGEIFASGLNLAAGYVNGRDPERFLENPLAVEKKYARLYRTGDYGSLKNGNIMYEGRTDSQVKIRGHRVDLSEVEKIVAELPLVEKAIVLCYRAGHVDQAILAFVKLRDDSPVVTEMQLEGRLKDKLADYMTPQVIILEHVPLLVNGKVDRQALLKTYETANNNEGDSSIVLDFDYSQVPEELKLTARDLFETVGGVIGRSTRASLSPRSNFYELGGNSLNSIFTVTLLREKGYNIGISEFIAAKNLGEIIEKMASNHDSVQLEEETLNACPHLKMEAVPLKLEHRQAVIDIIVSSFYNKADLEQWLKPGVLRTDYSDLLNEIWTVLVERELSFVVYDRNTERIIGTALNFDARAEPEVDIKSELIIIFEFLEFCEGPIRDNYLPKGLNQILHSFMMGTAEHLNPRENIACMHFMEYEVLNVARNKKFAGIFTTNTSPLTQQLADVYHYKTLLNYQVNEYVSSNGSRPFRDAPDEQRAIVHWKEVASK